MCRSISFRYFLFPQLLTPPTLSHQWQEELLTNTLQRKLSQVRSEKECVEAQLEAEVRGLAAVREKLEQKIRELQAEKESFESLVEHDLDGLLGKLQLASGPTFLMGVVMDWAWGLSGLEQKL